VTHQYLVNRQLCLHGTNPEAEHCVQWLLTVGDGTAATSFKITIPHDILFHGSVDNLANWVYPNLESYNQLNRDWISQRAIFTPKNEHVNFINKNLMMYRFPGDGSDEIVTQSADTLTQEFENARIPNKYLNTLNSPVFPPHCLCLKIDMPLILLRISKLKGKGKA
jgi:PIF1-like helicase